MANRPSISASPSPSGVIPAGQKAELGANPVRKAREGSTSARLAALPGWKVSSDFDSALARARIRLREWLRRREAETRSWLASVALHAILLLIIGLTVWFPASRFVPPFDVVVTEWEAGSELGFLDGHDLVGAGLAPPAGDPLEKWNVAGGPEDAPDGAADGGPALAHPRIRDVATAVVEPDDDDDEPAPAASGKGPAKSPGGAPRTPAKGTAREAGANVAGLLDGRGDEARARLVKKGGGTKESERAVELGLDWLARHQKSDGSWSFQHGPDDPGLLECPTGATGLALLAFLGHGNTHQKGRYRYQVDRGMKFLLDHLEETNQGAWFQGTGRATMYVQAICTLALCEDLSMSKDGSLRRPAQLAVDFIVNAQDREGGGWRYRIPQAGDTSVVGWQVMALTSARIAELTVHPRVLPKVSGFLKRVQSESGAVYGYTNPGSFRTSTTAVGLLCRMYLGREQSNRSQVRGMKHLDEWGPSPTDLYYDYYATMAMHHWGGPPWERWNNQMRRQLVETQAQEGDAAGSWVTDQSHGAELGGRLYTTCLSLLTLEVYYRYLPLYRKQVPLTDDPEVEEVAGAVPSEP